MDRRTGPGRQYRVGNVVCVDHLSIAPYSRAPQSVFQLSNIAGPGLLHQKFSCIIRNFLPLKSRLPRALALIVNAFE